MNEKLTEFVHRFRIVIYIAAILALLIKAEIILQKNLRASEIREEQCFWPPDMIPHPDPPRETGESDGKPKDLA